MKQVYSLYECSDKSDAHDTSLAYYTLFVAVREQWQNYFFAKKIKFCETRRKEVYTLFVVDSSFR